MTKWQTHTHKPISTNTDHVIFDITWEWSMMRHCHRKHINKFSCFSSLSLSRFLLFYCTNKLRQRKKKLIFLSSLSRCAVLNGHFDRRSATRIIVIKPHNSIDVCISPFFSIFFSISDETAKPRNKRGRSG